MLALEPAGDRVAAVRIVVNPDKLRGVPDGATAALPERDGRDVPRDPAGGKGAAGGTA